MANQIVLGIFDNYLQAGDAIDELKKNGFATDSISLIGKDTDDIRPVTAHTVTQSPDKLLTKFGIAGVIGGFLVGLVTVSVPGAGSLVVAGPVLAAISGAAAGAALGVVAGALVHFDVPETEAKIYEMHLTAGKVLVAVHATDPEERYKAERVFDQFGAIEVDTKAA